MRPFRKLFLSIPILLVLQLGPAHAALPGIASCNDLLVSLKKTAIDKTLDLMAMFKGLPKYLKQNDDLKTSERYLNYRNFGEMGLAEIGITVRYNKSNFDALNTGRPLVIVANHHLGIADGLAIQYMVGKARPQSKSLLFLARWIEKIMPHAIYDENKSWGTAVPVEINLPKKSDPLYDQKLADVKAFNTGWTRTSAKVLRAGGALVIFPAGHVASINDDGQSFPDNVYDSANSWQTGFLNLARLGKADIVFANVNSVNSQAFYTDRKRFGGGDKERVIWFFGEAVGKKGKTIDINLSKPMSMDQIYEALSQKFGKPRAALEADPDLTAELMRQFTYRITEAFPQALDTPDRPPMNTTPRPVNRYARLGIEVDNNKIRPLETALPGTFGGIVARHIRDFKTEFLADHRGGISGQADDNRVQISYDALEIASVERATGVLRHEVGHLETERDWKMHPTSLEAIGRMIYFANRDPAQPWGGYARGFRADEADVRVLQAEYDPDALTEAKMFFKNQRELLQNALSEFESAKIEFKQATIEVSWPGSHAAIVIRLVDASVAAADPRSFTKVLLEHRLAFVLDKPSL